MLKSLVLIIGALVLTTSCQATTTSTALPSSQVRGADILAGTNLWITTEVLTLDGLDVTDQNLSYVGLSSYDGQANTYEFFTLEGVPRGDRGLFFITEEPRMRVHYSQTLNYFRPVIIVELTPEVFTYAVENTSGQTVQVVHRPLFQD
jgi:hypothetical protein